VCARTRAIDDAAGRNLASPAQGRPAVRSWAISIGPTIRAVVGIRDERLRLPVRWVVLSLVAAALAVPAPAAAVPTFVSEWGGVGSAAGQFNQPYGVALDQTGNVYVTDALNHRVQKFDATGSFLMAWGWDVDPAEGTGFEVCTILCKNGSAGSGAGQFSEPYGIVVDALGDVYVTDRGNHRIQKFSPTGSFLLAWGWDVIPTPGGPTGLETCTAATSCKSGTPGAGDGQFNGPQGVGTDSEGKVYVADTQNRRIQRFSSSGAYELQWGTFGTGNGQFNLTYGVAADDFGTVYVVDANPRLQTFSSTGSFITRWGSQGSLPGEFSFGGGAGVDTDALGRVYVADYDNRRVQRFNSLGSLIDTFAIPGYSTPSAANYRPVGVAADGSGNVYVVNRFPHTVERFRDTAGPPAPPPVPDSGPPAAAARLNPPVLGRAVNVQVLKGEVLVSVPPGSARSGTRSRASQVKGRRFVSLKEARQIPVGSLLDTRRGTVRLTSATNTRGGIQSGDFTSGIFQVLQSRSRRSRGLTELRLKGSSFGRCASGRAGSAARAVADAAARRRLSRRTVRRLRSNARGRFRTRGRYSAATVRGTEWTTADRCDGTLTTVKRGEVVVRDLRRKKTIRIKAGKRYLAPARR
jgi:sugar lactone lactonase YvrE